MEKMPNGDLELTVPELQTAVVAVDLSPPRIARSSLSNRLRLAEQAVLEGLRSDPVTQDLTDNYHPTINNQSIDEAAETSLEYQRATGVDSIRTIVPADEVILFEDAITHLADCDTRRVTRHLVKKFRSKDAELYAANHILRASRIFDILFPFDI